MSGADRHFRPPSQVALRAQRLLGLPQPPAGPDHAIKRFVCATVIGDQVDKWPPDLVAEAFSLMELGTPALVHCRNRLRGDMAADFSRTLAGRVLDEDARAIIRHMHNSGQ